MRAFTVIGPSQSGKSSLVDALAGLEGGRPTTLALMGEARLSTFDFMGEPWAAFDIPGGLDNLAMVGPALAASDAAVLCIPPETDAAVLSAPYLRILEDFGIPTFVFVNRIDSASDRISEVISAHQHYCGHGIVLRQVPIREGGQIVGAVDLISERAWEYHDGARSTLIELPKDLAQREQQARADLLESLADFDDALLEQIIEDHQPVTDEVYGVATRALQHHDLVPALLGSASHGNGILRLMKSLRHEVPKVEALHNLPQGEEPVLAVASLADNVKHVGKTVLLRAVAEGVASGAHLGGKSIGALTEIDGRTQVKTLAPGAFALSVKSDHLPPAAYLGAETAAPLPEWARAHPPSIRRIVEPVHERDENKLSTALGKLAEIDPGLTVGQDETTGQPVIGVQGPLHLRRIVDKLHEGFGIEVDCAPVPTALRETIRKRIEKHHRHRKQSGGAGQFADVVIEVAPQSLDRGFSFSETVKGGAVPRNYIPSVEAGARDALAAGPAGYPVVDLAVVLKDGKSHSVDSSDFAFRTAGKNAVKEALEEAGTHVLQPIVQVRIDVPSSLSGGLVPLFSGLKGQVLGFEAHPDATGWDVFRALLPMASEEEFARALGSATRGTAWFSTELDHYEKTDAPVGVSA